MLLRVCICLFALLVAGQSLFAQDKNAEKRLKKITSEPYLVLDDTIYKKGKPYGLLVKTKSTRNPLLKDFSLKTLGGKELVYAKAEMVQNASGDNNVYYDITFMQSGGKAQVRQASFNFEKTWLTQIIDNDFVKGEEINADGEKRFLMLNKTDVAGNIQKEQSPDDNKKAGGGTTGGGSTGGVVGVGGGTLVQRDRSGMIMVMGNRIKQASVEIGGLKKGNQSSGGDSYDVYTITDINGGIVAEARVKTFGNSGNIEITTIVDHRQHVIAKKFGREAEDIVDYLIKNLYL